MTGEGPRVRSARLIGTLAIAGALAGVLIVAVFQKTLPAIEAHKAAVLQQAVFEVLKNPTHYDTLYVVDEQLTATAPETNNPSQLEMVFVGYDENGEVGWAIVGAEPGFQDIIRLIFGYDRSAGQLIGIKVLESKETPGLGEKIEKDTTFVGQFDGVRAPIRGVKAGNADEPDELDMITGATISSRAVIRIINNALERILPMIETYEASQ